MGRPTKQKVASRLNGAAQSKPAKGKKRAKKKIPPRKLIPVLRRSFDYIDKREIGYVYFGKMLPPTKKGYVWTDEVHAVRFCMVRERHVRFEDSPPVKASQDWREQEQQDHDELTKAFRWIRKLPNDPELRGSKLPSLAKRAGVELRA